MEIDADRCEYRLAGSAAFESAIRRLNVLSKVAADLYKEMRVSWTRNHQLPDNLPALLFSWFDVPARQVTLLHYTDDLNLPVVPAALVRTTP